MRLRSRGSKRKGAVLLAVLVVVVLLSLAAYQFSTAMLAESKAVESYRRAAQARALADSGIHYAAAMLATPDSISAGLNGNPWSNPSAFQGVAVSDDGSRRGVFSVISPILPDDQDQTGEPYRYGVTDENGKLNLNALMKLDSSGDILHDRLMTLPNMTEDVANAIIDWMDEDDSPRSNGAESEYYMSLDPPYRTKNGPLDSLEELLLVRGVTTQLLFGNDLNRNGVLDPGEDDGSGGLDLGWSAYLTIYSREQNVDSTGAPRVWINDGDLNNLQSQMSSAGIDDSLSNFILAYRLYGPYKAPSTSGNNSQGGNKNGQGGASTPAGGSGSMPSGGNQGGNRQGSGGRGGRQVGGVGGGGRQGGSRTGGANTPASGVGGVSGGGGSGVMAGGGGATGGAGTRVTIPQNGGGGQLHNVGSLFDLVGVQVQIPSQQQGGQPTTLDSPLNDSGKLRQLLPQLLDKMTTTQDAELPARVNINTAPRAVLAALPGLDDSDVQAILSKRPSLTSTDAPDDIYQTPAWLMTEANMTKDKLSALEKYASTRAQVYRMQVVGYFEGGGPQARVEAVIDTTGGKPRIAYWRDLGELGRSFDLTNTQP